VPGIKFLTRSGKKQGRPYACPVFVYSDIMEARPCKRENYLDPASKLKII
jgi:hypothetical protein